MYRYWLNTDILQEQAGTVFKAEEIRFTLTDPTRRVTSQNRKPSLANP
jgi:hypothetical protein